MEQVVIDGLESQVVVDDTRSSELLQPDLCRLFCCFVGERAFVGVHSDLALIDVDLQMVDAVSTTLHGLRSKK
ncbi:hypothetical protein RND71_018136 [Anisodus tanguticus]|uniref:Uncharacterized protein n=1 Tax=Anisodus tanguticus TaxID=243964 RepID=A0AAE1S3M8_9SOLA|nr:hypothetical protein RND71_018136 [Anisodus tanguticus]